MQRRFTDRERVVIKNNYKDEPLLKMAGAACRFFDDRLQGYCLWPEEIFNEVACILDEVKEQGDEYIPEIENLWKVIYSRFRKEDTSVPAEELKLAVSIILDIVSVTLKLSKDSVHQYMGLQVLGVISHNNKEEWEQVLVDLSKQINYLSDELGGWINRFMALDNEHYLSDEIEELLEPKTEKKEAKKKVKKKDITPFEPDLITFSLGRTLHYNITILYQSLCKLKWIEATPDDFLELFSGKISGIKVVWTDKVGKDNLYALFNMMEKEGFIKVPEGHGMSRIVESHFINKEGAYVTGINSGKPGKKTLELLVQWQKDLSARQRLDD